MIATQSWFHSVGANGDSALMDSGLIDLRAYNAEFREWGDGPPIVLVPGLAGGIDLIEPFARELAREHRVICYQLRGEDDCFALRRRFTINDLADDLAEFVELRGLEKPAVMGISFGGVIAFTAAARYSRSFSALALQGVGLRFEANFFHRIASMVLSAYPLPSDNPFVNQFFNLLFGGRVARQQSDRAIQCCWETDQSMIAFRLSLLRRLSFAAMTDRIRIPTSIISGGRDLIVSPENSRQLAERLCDCQQTVIARAGHLAPLSHSRETASAISRFLAAVAV